METVNLTTADHLISEEEALNLIESAIKQSQAEGVFVSLDAEESALSRFSENQISQNIHKNRFSLTVTSYFGRRSASASTTELDPEAIAQVVRRSEALARFAPEDPEWVELLSPQTYEPRTPAFDRPTSELSPLARGEIIRQVCSLSQQAGVNGSGTLSTRLSLNAIGNSLGLRGCDRTSEADFSFTARQDNGSNWNRSTAWSVEQLPIQELTSKTIEKAIASRHPRDIEPGDYTVILEPAAMSSLLPWVIWNLDARAADEGRSFMSRRDELGQPVGNRVGEQLFSPILQVYREPAHPLLQSGRFFSDGLPNNYLEIVKNGIPQTLSYSRYWAKKQDQQPTGAMYPLVMTGSDRSVTDLISNTERGILVSRAWYVRYVNPRTLEVTGMTRDGTFAIADGQIAYPIKNLRFNQGLPQMLQNLEAVSTPQRCGSSVIPGCKVNNFHFSSITDSI
ncbi:MAG: TldD/PmbA family protein [Pleurocapsa sp.]